MTRRIILYTDGASRGNPGPAAIGVVIRDEHGNELEAWGEVIGRATNNVAEYRALVRGLERAAVYGNVVEIRTDSELLARQLCNTYRVRASHLQELHVQVQHARQRFARTSIVIIPRAQNQRADALAKAALDREGKM